MEKKNNLETNSMKLQFVTNIFIIIFIITSLFMMTLTEIRRFSNNKTDETKTVEVAKPTKNAKVENKKTTEAEDVVEDNTVKTDE